MAWGWEADHVSFSPTLQHTTLGHIFDGSSISQNLFRSEKFLHLFPAFWPLSLSTSPYLSAPFNSAFIGLLAFLQCFKDQHPFSRTLNPRSSMCFSFMLHPTVNFHILQIFSQSISLPLYSKLMSTLQVQNLFSLCTFIDLMEID